MTARFCGNPRNHDAHEYEYMIDHALPPLQAWCDGVGVEAFEKTVERYDPTEQAMDGTPYSEITIAIKDASGMVTTIHAERAAFMQFEVEHQKYVSLEFNDGYRTPRIEKARLEFQPYQYGEPGDKPFTITREQQ